MDRKLELKRLCIYIILSFGMAWIMFIAYAFTGHKWDGEQPLLESFVGLGMLTPIIANLITRFITGEGFAFTGKNSMMLGISFRDKKWVYYLLAIFAPWLYFELGNLIAILMVPASFNFENYKQTGIKLSVLCAVPLICIVGGLIGSFAAFGEEGGWRAYMMPKLINILGLKKAVIFGGIIWGLWHAPLTCIGHNFGTEYPGFPYVGIIFMCIDCTFVGIMLTFVTIRTNSIWPAAFMHAINNQNPSILRLFIDMEVFQKNRPFQMCEYVALNIPNVILGCICLVLLCKSKDTLSSIGVDKN